MVGTGQCGWPLLPLLVCAEPRRNRSDDRVALDSLKHSRLLPDSDLRPSDLGRLAPGADQTDRLIVRPMSQPNRVSRVLQQRSRFGARHMSGIYQSEAGMRWIVRGLR